LASPAPGPRPLAAPALAILLAVGFAAAVGYLFGVEFAAGDVYPEYSSLRADPKGAKLLLDSLARIPGVSAERSYLPLEFLPDDFLTGNQATVLLLGLDPETFAKDPAPYLKSIEKLAARGNRVVAALQWDPDNQLPRADALAALWQVSFGLDPHQKHPYLYFAEAKDWAVLEAIGPKLLAIERAFGKGSVVLLAGSEDFNNESTAAGDRLKMVSAAIGPNRRILFDEPHLGISETGSVVGLARRFHLAGMAFGLALCAALFIWKNASVFPPPSATQPQPLSGRTSLSGLLTLLRRHIPADEVASLCWREWITAHRRELSPARVSQAEEILRDSAARPLDAARDLHSLASVIRHPAAVPKGLL
jgi:hypothetical protein